MAGWIPFDPRLETSGLWPGFHNEFIVVLKEHLVRSLRPRYLAHIEERVYISWGEPPDLLYRPDISLVRSDEAVRTVAQLAGRQVATPVIGLIGLRDEVRESYVVLRTLQGELVAIVELLSPNNKRPGHEGRQSYIVKRDKILASSVHLIEIDLLVQGERMPLASPWPAGERYTVVVRSTTPGVAEIYPMAADQPLPVIRFPLRAPDPDHPLDLQAVFEQTWTRGGYDLLVERVRTELS